MITLTKSNFFRWFFIPLLWIFVLLAYWNETNKSHVLNEDLKHKYGVVSSGPSCYSARSSNSMSIKVDYGSPRGSVTEWFSLPISFDCDSIKDKFYRSKIKIYYHEHLNLGMEIEGVSVVPIDSNLKSLNNNWHGFMLAFVFAFFSTVAVILREFGLKRAAAKQSRF